MELTTCRFTVSPDVPCIPWKQNSPGAVCGGGSGWFPACSMVAFGARLFCTWRQKQVIATNIVLVDCSVAIEIYFLLLALHFGAH